MPITGRSSRRVKRDRAGAGPGACVPKSAASYLTYLLLVASPAVGQDADLEAAVELPAVSVTANSVPTPLEAVGSAVTIITGSELEEQQIRLVSDALRAVPGLAVNRTGGPGSLTQVRIRGAEGNQTLVIIDGIEMNDPSGGSEFDFANLLATDIARIEVLRGPQSALYGSDAAGGVINIVTRKGEGPVTASGSLEGGSFNSWLGHASLNGGDERYNFLAGAAGYQTDGVSTNKFDSEIDGHKFGTLYGKVGISLSSNLDVGLVGRYQASETDGDDVTGLYKVGDSSHSSEQFFGRAQASLSLLDDSWQQVLGIAYTDHDRWNKSETYGESDYRGKKLKFDYQSNLFFETPAIAGAGHVLTFAVEHERESVVSTSSYSDFDKSINSNGFVGQYQLDLFDGLSLTGAIRFDQNSQFADATTYRGTAAYLIDETNTKLRASYGTGVKNPTLFELYGYSGNWHGNPDLEPERSKGWDAGLDQALFADRVVASITYFDQRIDKLIQGAGDTAINLDGVSRANGVELSVTVFPLENLSIQASYSYMKTRDGNGEELVRRPANIASVYIDYRFLDRRANVNLGIVYNGRQADWYFPPYLEPREDVTLSGYTLVSLAASYDVTDYLQVYGRIENLLDQDYEEVFTYGTPGIGAFAGLRLTF